MTGGLPNRARGWCTAVVILMAALIVAAASVLIYYASDPFWCEWEWVMKYGAGCVSPPK